MHGCFQYGGWAIAYRAMLPRNSALRTRMLVSLGAMLQLATETVAALISLNNLTIAIAK